MAERKTLESLVIETRPRVHLTPVLEPFKDGYRIHHIESGSIASGARDTFVPLRHVSKQKRRIFELEDENAKLRELMRDMFHVAYNNGYCAHYCVHGGECKAHVHCILRKQMHELGIEASK